MDTPRRPPSRAVALLLACLGPGLGQLYLGRHARGLVFLGAGLSFAPVAVLAAHAGPSTGALHALLSGALVALLAFVAGILDAAIPRASDGLRPPPAPALVVGVLSALVAVGLLLGIGGALWVRANLFEAFRLPTGSMTPTLLPGDHVLVEKHTTWARPLQRGDIVVYRLASEGGRAHVKRVVGLPGESVALWGEAAVVAGTPLALLVPRDPAEGGGRAGIERFPGGGEVTVAVPDAAGPGAPVEVPPGHCFVLGDHRSASADSREHGPVPLDAIVGVVPYRYWPPGRMGLVR